jgi:hypothetical protein
MLKKVLFFTIAIFILIQPFAAASDLSQEDEKFLNMVEKDIFDYFIEETNPRNGLIKDSSRPGAPCSVAACGFGLTALCIGEKRGWISYDEAYDRALKMMVTFRDKVPHEHGYFYHFIDMRNCNRVWSCEVSSIDTALFFAGALYAAEYFKGSQVDRIAKKLYKRVEWPWMARNGLISMGYKPETGIFPYYWSSYNEAMILYALAIGSPTHPLDPDSWRAWKRPVAKYDSYELIYCATGSLFVYQYSHCWIDFRSLDDEGINWFENSIKATEANRAFCINNKDKYKTYGADIWGLTASTGPRGYKGYGAKPGHPVHDGTMCPYGAIGSIAFTPELSLESMKYMYKNHKDKIYKKYGFVDAFNMDKNWLSNEYIGISMGAGLLMIENYRSGLIWKYFMRSPYIQKWLSACFGINPQSLKRQLI